MVFPAFDARDVTGKVLLKDRTLMELWKWASEEGQILAIRDGKQNFSVVKDAELAERIKKAAPDLKVYSFDPATERILDA